VGENYQSKTIQTNGIQLHAIEAGPEDGELVLLLHGFPEFWRGWSKQITPLADAGYLVVAPDQRGYNLSEKPSDVASYHIDILANDIIGILQAYNRKQAFIVGHDWGAAVAWHISTYYPDTVKKLVILNVPHPAIIIFFLRRSIKQLLKSWYIFFFQIPSVPEWVLSRNNYQAIRKMMLASSNPGTFIEQDLAYYKEAWGQHGALTAMLNWYRAAFRSAVRNLSKARKMPDVRVRVPTLMLWGAKDIALSNELVQPSIGLCDDGRVVYYEDATHWVQHDQASQITQDILDFIKK
jgi:pimeloyl-ACP methyl ester carboxylesterase